jgi:hypothetical protein
LVVSSGKPLLELLSLLLLSLLEDEPVGAAVGLGDAASRRKRAAC